MSYYDEVMADSPRLYLPLDAVPATVEPATTISTGSLVQAVDAGGPCLYFPGGTSSTLANSHVTVANGSMPAGSYATFSVEMWLNHVPNAAQSQARPFYYYDAGTGMTAILQGDSTGRATLNYGRFNNGMINVQVGSGVPKIYKPGVDEWVHSVMTFDNGTLSLYINGVLEYSTTGAVPTIGGANDIILGRSQAATQTHRAYKGYMRNVSVYSQALSPERILAHYNAGTGVEPEPPVEVATDNAGWMELFGNTPKVELTDVPEPPKTVSLKNAGWMELYGHTPKVELVDVPMPPKVLSLKSAGWMELFGNSAKVELTDAPEPPKTVSLKNAGWMELFGKSAKVELTDAVEPMEVVSNAVGWMELWGNTPTIAFSDPTTPLLVSLESAGWMELFGHTPKIELGEEAFTPVGKWNFIVSMRQAEITTRIDSATTEAVMPRKRSRITLKYTVVEG